MRGEEAVHAAETLLDEALDDLRDWRSALAGSVDEATYAEAVRLKVALAHELGLMQYAPVDLEPVAVDEDPLVDATITCGHETVTGNRFVPVPCTLDHGHGGPHEGLVAFDDDGGLLFPLEAARLNEAQLPRAAVSREQLEWTPGADGRGQCDSHEPGTGWRCALSHGHDGNHVLTVVPWSPVRTWS